MLLARNIDMLSYKYHQTCDWSQNPCEKLDISL